MVRRVGRLRYGSCYPGVGRLDGAAPEVEDSEGSASGSSDDRNERIAGLDDRHRQVESTQNNETSDRRSLQVRAASGSHGVARSTGAALAG